MSGSLNPNPIPDEAPVNPFNHTLDRKDYAADNIFRFILKY